MPAPHDPTSTLLQITSKGTRIPVGFTSSFQAIFLPGDSPKDVTQIANWTVSPSTAANIQAGKVRCSRAGVAYVSASYENAEGTVAITCAPAALDETFGFLESSEEFVGPFPSWTDLKGTFNAIGDGVADDTQALQNALDNLNSTEAQDVLYIPSGTYKITSTLHINYKQFFYILGHDPRTTRIVWAGPAGGTMLEADGSAWFRTSRLTLDGAHLARIAEDVNDNMNGYYTTKVELSDLHIVDVDYGIKLDSSAETAIERVYFDGNAAYGVLLGSPNAINIFVTDSLFRECGTGVSNNPGAGSFNVSNSYFIHSTVADISIANTEFFSIRHNVSVGSAAFFLAGSIGANNAEITIEGNKIFDTLGTPIVIGNTGPLMLIDNVFRTGDAVTTIVSGTDDYGHATDVFSFGNLYTISSQFSSPSDDGGLTAINGQVLQFDDSVVDAESIPDVLIPANVYVPPVADRAVFEVNGSDDRAIQAAIDAATASGQVRPVVHLIGHYMLYNTVVFPSGSDIQLLGDEINATKLYWHGGDTGVAFRIPTSSVKHGSLYARHVCTC